MARLQILELPTEHHGDDMVTPFVLVVDEYQPLRHLQGIDQDETPMVDEFAGVAKETGARTVLVFRETVEIPANDAVTSAPLATPAIRVEGDFERLRHVVRDELQKAQMRRRGAR